MRTLLKIPFRRQKLFETRVSSAAPEEVLDVRVPIRQLLLDKPKCEIVAQFKIVLVGNRKVSIRCFKIGR